MLNKNFDGLMIKLASPKDVEEWSNGAVTFPDTINYRTGKPKKGGLFCESIFGPTKNYECNCGKYKGVRYKGIVCERCGVEVTTSRVRRTKMGHVDLVSPVVHVWYAKAIPSRVGLLLKLSRREIEKVLYYVKYIVLDVNDKQKKNIMSNLDKDYEKKLTRIENLYEEEMEKLDDKKKDLEDDKFKSRKENIENLYSENKKELQEEYNRIKSILGNLEVGSTILESDYRNIFYKYDGAFEFGSGAEAIKKLLKKIDLGNEVKTLLKEFPDMRKNEKKKAKKRLKLLINLITSGVKPEWMVLEKIPVIPPDLRPVVQLEGGKFASSDLNLFYRRVIMRNKRLKKMIDAGMPDVIKKNEVRLLQESVNNLIIGEKGNSGGGGSGSKVNKSLTDNLSGKKGIFRKNLLGKRVDYSGRSVITVGPDLELDECGIPLYMARKMFGPFVVGKLIEKDVAHTPKKAESLLDEGAPIALKILEEIVDGKYVLLNRAPTLHRLGIQAFKVKLVPGKTVRVHPLICPGFNADFDGDQMAVHLPLSKEAQKEAKELMSSAQNVLKPGSGEPVITHSQDMVIGAYCLTYEYGASDEIKGIFGSIKDVVEAYDADSLGSKDRIKLLLDGKDKPIETIVGRVLLNSLLPDELDYINKTVDKGVLKQVLDDVFDKCGRKETVKVADRLKEWGFKYATLAASTMNVFDINVPNKKYDILNEGEESVKRVHDLWWSGFMSDEEKHNEIVKVWTDTKKKIAKLVKSVYSEGNDLYEYIDSGARGSYSQLTQLSGMKGLVASPSGRTIELPIKSSFVEGFTPIEYFISSHGARKGKADTALRTAESGYLTRRLVDATQEVVVREEDCGTDNSMLISRDEAQMRGKDFEKLIYGRVLAKDLKDNEGNTILEKETMITNKEKDIIQEKKLDRLYIRSPLTCESVNGVCKKCYGMDLSTRKLVRLGEAIGVISAQSIGEPGTQLTMRTFHTGGVATEGGDMTQGIKRVEQLMELRTPKKPAIIAPFDGTVKFSRGGKNLQVSIVSEYQPEVYIIKDGYEAIVEKDDYLEKGGNYAKKGRSKLKVKEEGKVLKVNEDNIVLGVKEKFEKTLSSGLSLNVQEGDSVYKGQVLTSGALDVQEYNDIVGNLEAQKYIVRELDKVYASQGQNVNDKYMEVVVKQLFSRVRVQKSGDSGFIPGSIVIYEEFKKVNEKLKKEDKQLAQGERLVYGLSKVAKSSSSWLSSASFQETKKVLTNASVKGQIDSLVDLKSNAIIGRKLPIGQVYRDLKDGKDISHELNITD